jgi:aryl-alcohol dehydrogenase-like predicted oxidoreductase
MNRISSLRLYVVSVFCIRALNQWSNEAAADRHRSFLKTGVQLLRRPWKHAPFGHSGLSVPVIGMGTWRTFDVRGRAEEARAHAVGETAVQSWANLFDSSPMYGEAERVLGDAVRAIRDRVMIATKVWAHTSEEGYQQVTRALAYFGRRVDLYQIHNLVN